MGKNVALLYTIDQEGNLIPGMTATRLSDGRYQIPLNSESRLEILVVGDDAIKNAWGEAPTITIESAQWELADPRHCKLTVHEHHHLTTYPLFLSMGGIPLQGFHGEYLLGDGTILLAKMVNAQFTIPYPAGSRTYELSYGKLVQKNPPKQEETPAV